jgi:2-keto-3-deoxy-6-phosphogluconate aldolase
VWFLVTPTFDEGVVRTGNRYEGPIIVGVATPTEALNTYEAGATMCKTFPPSSQKSRDSTERGARQRRQTVTVGRRAARAIVKQVRYK